MRRRSKAVIWPEDLTEFVEDRWLDVPLASACGMTAREALACPAYASLPESKRLIWRRAHAWDAYAAARRVWIDENLPARSIDWDLAAWGNSHRILSGLQSGDVERVG